MRDAILIVGGYGQVGRYVTLRLLENPANKIIVAGRSIAKANSFAIEKNNEFETMQLDIYNIDAAIEALNRVKVVVMCLSPQNNHFAEYCVKNSIHYIDISPSNDVAKTLSCFNQDAVDNRATCVLGVGIAPGLSNLLVKELSEYADKLKNVTISLLLGVGEPHGSDGIKWLLDHISRDFTVKINGTNESVAPFVGNIKTVFAEPIGKRTAYRFNLADQHIVPQTLRVENAASYFCYDSKFVTKYVSLLKRTGIFGLLRFKTAYHIMLRLFIAALSFLRTLHIGTDLYGIQIDAVGIKDGREYPCHIGTTGNNNSEITGHIAAFVAAKLFAGNQPCGVFYIEELFSLKDVSEFGIQPLIRILF